MDYDERTTHYLALAEQMLDEAFGEERALWIRRVEAELPHIREVLAWLAEAGDAARGLRLTYLLQELWFEEPYTGEGLATMERFLALAGAGDRPSLQAACLDLAGALALSLNRPQRAAALKEEAIAILRALDEPGQLGYALLHHGHLLGYGQGDYGAAGAAYREALALLAQVGDEEGVAHATANLAAVALELGQVAEAQALVAESLDRYTALGSEWDLALTLGNAAGVAAALGDFERAVRLAAAGAAQRRRLGVSLPVAFQSRLRQIEEAAVSGLDEAQRPAAWAAGQAMTLEAAVAHALAP